MNLLELNPSEDIKKYIKFEGKCISQVIDFIPDEIIFNQVCEIFSYIIKKGYKTRFKSPEILFLTLLYNSNNIKEIIDKIQKSNKKYVLTCCISEEFKEFEINSYTLRERMSSIAINSLDRLF